jgi:hypothetical protein
MTDGLTIAAGILGDVGQSGSNSNTHGVAMHSDGTLNTDKIIQLARSKGEGNLPG